MNFKSRIASILATGILTVSITSLVYGDNIKLYEDIQTTQLSKGTEHRVITRFYDQGWVKLNVLEVDLKTRGTRLKVLSSIPTLKDRLPLTVLSEIQGENIIGAVNGDFFDTNTAESIGPIYINGDIISSSKNDPRFSVFSLTEDGLPSIDYFITDKMSVSNTSKGTEVKLDYINKAYKPNALIYVDNKWSPTTFGYDTEDILEILVINNRIKEIRFNQEAVSIPQNGYALIATGQRALELKDSFKKNNKLNINTNIPNGDNIELAMGGGAKIVENGKLKTPFSLAISGHHPRTALGISQDKRRLYLVTVDGRTSSYPGLTQEELGNIMIELGSYNAVNLDGGGSTEMVIKNPSTYGYEIVNRPSSGHERSIANGIGVINDSIQGNFKELILSTDDTNVFAGTSRAINVTGYDKNYNPYNINLKYVDFKVEGVEGYFKDNVFYPTTAGKALITVSYKGSKKTIELNVLSKPVELSLSPSKISFEKLKDTNFDIKLLDENGYTAKVDSASVTWSFTNTDAKDITALKSIDTIDSTILVAASFEDLTSYAQIAKYYKPTITEDFEFLRGSFASYPTTVKGSYDLSSSYYGGRHSAKLEYDFSNVSSNKAAYFVFNDGGKVLNDNTRKIGLWVYGNKGNNHWLRAKVVGADGRSMNLTLARNIDWTGWQEVSTEIPSSLSKPVKIERIYVVEPDLTLADAGKILFDTLTEYSLAEIKDSIPEKVRRDKYLPMVSDTMDTSGFSFNITGKRDVNGININDLTNHVLNNGDLSMVFSPNDQKELIKSGIHVGTPNPYKMYTIENATFIELANDKHGLRSRDYTQWQWLLAIKDSISTENVFITLPNKLYFKDKLEKELFFKVLKELKSSGKNVCVISGGVNNWDSLDVLEGVYIVSLKPSNGLKYMHIRSGDSGIYFGK